MYAQLSVSAQHLVFALLTAADVVEQWPFKPKVVGSIPTAPTNFSFALNHMENAGGTKGALG